MSPKAVRTLTVSLEGIKIFRISHIVIAIVGLVALCTQAQSRVWQGQLGSAPIVMELDISMAGDHVEGRYFYRKYNADILLVGKKTEDGRLHLTEGDARRDEDESKLGRITLSPKGKGWQGEWQGSEGKKPLLVTLNPLDASALATENASARATLHYGSSSPYDLTKRAGMRLKVGKIQKFMGYTLEWMEEPITNIEMFRVRDGFSDETLDRINAILEEQQWQEIYGEFSCKGMIERTVTPHFLNARWLSISISTEYYCGITTHPESGGRFLNLDIESGKLLGLEDFLWLKTDDPKLPHNADVSRENYEYEEKFLAPWLVQTMTSLYPREMTPLDTKDEENSCDYMDAEIWKFPGWYLTPKGIYIAPSFPHVAGVCRYPKWSILPWSIVNKHPGRLGGKLL